MYYKQLGTKQLREQQAATNSLKRKLNFIKLSTFAINSHFRPGLGWERLRVVTLKWRYINSIDR